MSRILVTEKIADPGLDRLRAAGHDVDVQLDLSPEQLCEQIKGASALIVRSSTQVTADVLDAADELVMVGRAGIGLDNVDVAAATTSGVMVVNAPHSNTLSAAEHTMAMMLAMARNVPQAHAALKEGRWERSRWNGVELSEKTLGIVGLGRIGTLVAERAMAFGMRLIAYDPFVTAERARQINVELVELDALMERADFVTLHLARTPETIGLIGAERLAAAKRGIRIINVARGGIVDEQALADAIRAGQVAGAAIDVFSKEPCTDSPLFALDEVVVTPHLGASTVEAQDKAGDVIADMVLLALGGEFVPFAVNVEAAEASETIKPYLGLAEELGRVFAGLRGTSVETVDVEYCGQIADYDTRILTLSLMKGYFGAMTDGGVSYVNAPQLASQHGTEFRSIPSAQPRDYLNLISVSGGGRAVAGTLMGLSQLPRIVMIDDHSVEVPLAGHLMVIHNEDIPGRIGVVGSVLGEHGVNIADMKVGRNVDGKGSMMVVTCDSVPTADVVTALEAIDGIETVQLISRA